MDNLNNADNLNSYGFSLYAACQVINRTELFIRYDRLLYSLLTHNDTSGIKGNGNTLMSGISFSPVTGINLSLNYQGWIADKKTTHHRKIFC